MSSEAMTERELEEIEKLLPSKYEQQRSTGLAQTFMYQCQRLLQEVRSSHAEAAELREKLNSAGEHEALDAAADDVEYQRLEQENAGLRRRVGELEGTVQSLLGGVSTRVAYFGFYDGHTAQHRKETIDAAHAALSQANAQAKLENQEEEEE